MPLILKIAVACLMQMLWDLPPKVNEVNKTIGVWIAAPRHTTLFDSYAQLKSGIETLSDLGINTLFLCAWADHKTAFESEVLLSHSNYEHLEETSLFQNTNYEGVFLV